MRAGITALDRARLEALVAARGSPQKHVWRARIILLTDDGLGTVAIMAATGKSKTCVWRWQERFMADGVDGLLRDKTRPPRIAPLETALVDKVVALTLKPPGHEATHWTVRAMARAVGIAASSVVKIWHDHGLAPHRGERGTGSPGGDMRSRTTEVHAPRIMAAYEATPDGTLAELRAALAEDGIGLAVATLWRFFRRRRITRKKRPATPLSRIAPTF